VGPGTYGGQLTMDNTSNNVIARLQSGTNGGQLYLYNHSNTNAVFIRSTSYGGAIDIRNSSGTTVGQLTTGSGNSDGTMYLNDGSGSNTINAIGQTGKITCVSLTQTSSRKTKENIKPIEDSEKILDLQAVSFDFKNKEQGTNKRGFIAEDVKEILPNLVTNDETPSLNYIEMIPYLQDVIKKQEARIKALEEKLYGSN
jgi:hypothetical protein